MTPANAGSLPEGFQESTAISGLSEPSAVRFSPDGRVFVAEKSGIIKVYDDLADTTPTTFADLRTQVFNLYDRGMLGFSLAPNFPADPYVYVLYSHDAPIGGTAPRWGAAGGSVDDCPVPTDGCLISGRLSRLKAAGNAMTGTEHVLVEDWCQQYSSHTIGDIAFGPDGALYASGGDGASFDFADYGQGGNPVNPCGDPPKTVGGIQSPPTAEGGALRAQDIRSHVPSPQPVDEPIILRPDTDITSDWTVAGGGTAWDALDDAVSPPADVPLATFIYEKAQGKVTEVGLSTRSLGASTPTGGKAWFYGNVPAGASFKVDVVWGGQVRASSTVDGGASGAPYAWRSIAVTPPDQAAVDDLRLRFTVVTGGAAGGNMLATYFELNAPGAPPPVTTNRATLRPDSDVTSQWQVGGGGATWDALDDAVTQPASVPLEKFIYESAVGRVSEVGMTTKALAGGTPSASKAWFYGNVTANASVKVDVISGGQVRGTTTVSGGASGAVYQWRSVDFTLPDQAAVDDVRLRFSLTVGATRGSNVFAAYIDLEYATPSEGAPGGSPGADPTGLNGSLIRVDPATGSGLPGNPNAASSDPNERRIVAYGLRNPFRFTLRPGTDEAWIGDVGWGDWEEINRLANPIDNDADNFGWPCYEGSGRQPGYDSADLDLCESLYAAPAVVDPYFKYSHTSKVVPGEDCPAGSSSLSGAAFHEGSAFPSSYQGSLFFADYSRSCIWAMQAGADGLPDPSKVSTFGTGASAPADLVFGPDGNLYYVDIAGGRIQRIAYTGGNEAPTAVAEATPTSGPVPLAVQFDGTASSDPEADNNLTYEWDLDGDGQFNDSTAAKPTHSFASAGTYVVSLKVTDPQGYTGTSSVTVKAGNTRPVANITAPETGSLWRVGQQLTFAGTGTDAQDGALAAPRYSWELTMEHCPSNCHTHLVQTYPGVVGGSFVAPDHEYPSHMVLRLTVTDSGGLTDTDTLELDPRTVNLSLKSASQPGLQLIVNATAGTTPFSRTVIQNSVNSISAPSPQTLGDTSYTWLSWSDAGARTHNVIATANRTYTASFEGASPSATTAQLKARRKARAKKRKKKCRGKQMALVKAGKKPGRARCK